MSSSAKTQKFFAGRKQDAFQITQSVPENYSFHYKIHVFSLKNRLRPFINARLLNVGVPFYSLLLTNIIQIFVCSRLDIDAPQAVTLYA